MTKLHPADRDRVIMLPRTIPARSAGDLAPYHFVTGESGAYSLRRGAPPAAVAAAARAVRDGGGTLNDLLDSIGVPKL